MNWVLYVMSGLNVLFGLNYVRQTGKVMTVEIKPSQAAVYMFSSLVGAVIMFIAAWRLS